MKDLTVEEELQTEMDLFQKELNKVSDSFGVRLILVLALCLGVVYTAIFMHLDLYFYSLLQFLLLSLGLITWDFIDTNKKTDKILNNSNARTSAILNKYYPIGE